jgi:hypothetical protein
MVRVQTVQILGHFFPDDESRYFLINTFNRKINFRSVVDSACIRLCTKQITESSTLSLSSALRSVPRLQLGGPLQTLAKFWILTAKKVCFEDTLSTGKLSKLIILIQFCFTVSLQYILDCVAHFISVWLFQVLCCWQTLTVTNELN